ncbi:MAG: MarR family winged helix-turn-helix transcriptional regulator [Bacillota bacterium]|jgi:DNA-binding MarR family transcriptional regulator
MRSVTFKNEIWDTLRLLSAGLDAAFKPAVEDVGLTMMQARILFEIWQNDDATVGRLGDIFGVNSGNCSTMCKKLEKAGLIDRIRSKEDERIVTLSLTAQGKEVLNIIERKLNDKYNPVLESQPQEKFDKIIEGMNALQELLQELVDKYSQRSKANE